MTEANLNNASFQWVCNLATHCSVLVHLCLRKIHLFSGVRGSISSVTESKGEGLGACQLCTSTDFKLKVHDGKVIVFLPASSVLWQVLKTI